MTGQGHLGIMTYLATFETLPGLATAAVASRGLPSIRTPSAFLTIGTSFEAQSVKT